MNEGSCIYYLNQGHRAGYHITLVTLLNSTQFCDRTMTPSARFFCPGCERKDFGSLAGIKKHFKKQSHSLRCSICQRAFKDALAIIQHHQMSKCGPKSTPDIPQQRSPPTLPSREVQNESPEGTVEPSGHRIEIPEDRGPSSSVSSTPLASLAESSVSGT